MNRVNTHPQKICAGTIQTESGSAWQSIRHAACDNHAGCIMHEKCAQLSAFMMHAACLSPP